MQKGRQRLVSILTGLLMTVGMLFLAKELAVYTSGDNVVKEKEQVCIVLDAGHGGDDPGKIGINGSREKDINLAITLRVKEYLEANDIRVVLTREDESGLYDPDASNKKVQDMKQRIAIIEKTQPLAAVSIHQNSYTEEYVNGAQVFYYKDSKGGETLAALLQESLRARLNPENHRQMKANDSYYLLKKTQIPTVIVECGFLSNSKEAELLSSEEYQDKVAWAVFMGIMQFISEV
ncbi:MAG: N-acetylmuramoyl-L-alanine amidase [Lachnospiraceae bacterium]|nr:N-acetylmuramoyl-L-alanine amidase [Lachnospiraceae bacterium]